MTIVAGEEMPALSVGGEVCFKESRDPRESCNLWLENPAIPDLKNPTIPGMESCHSWPGNHVIPELEFQSDLARFLNFLWGVLQYQVRDLSPCVIFSKLRQYCHPWPVTHAILGLGLTCNPCPGNPELQDPRTPAGACNPWLLVIALGLVCPLATVLYDPPLHCTCCPLYSVHTPAQPCQTHCSTSLPTIHTTIHPCPLYTLLHNLAHCTHCSTTFPQ